MTVIGTRAKVRTLPGQYSLRHRHARTGGAQEDFLTCMFVCVLLRK